ncbi:MAG: hypothetical protein NUW01_05550 [Gemmatimonadaceae bacterium]|nr:hypothetical protein [Gemmatimonadaceae bacterium]
MSKSKQPEIVSAQAWKCPCGAVNGRPEVDVCSCGEWTVDGPVKAATGERINKAAAKLAEVAADPADEAPDANSYVKNSNALDKNEAAQGGIVEKKLVKFGDGTPETVVPISAKD